MNIERAYCLEMETVIDIYQARQFYFSNDLAELHFLCSYEKCLAMEVKVIGVNYRKLIEEMDMSRIPHFRSHKDFHHHENCEWIEIAQAKQELKKESKDVGIDDYDDIGKTKVVKASNVVDVFVPIAANEHLYFGKISEQDFFANRRMANKRERINNLKTHLRQNESRSSILENVVTCFRFMDVDQRKSTELKIQGIGRGTYRSFFKHIKFYLPGEQEVYIYYGGAKCKKIGKCNYSLRFFDPISSGQPVSIYLKEDQLSTYKHNAYLLKMLESAAQREARYVTCYFFGHISASNKNSHFFDVTLDHLDNLVLILQ